MKWFVVIAQFGALPYRISGGQDVEMLLVTSRDTGRWVVPKGNPMPRREGHETAACEALEEAGVEGQIDPQPIGAFRYRKRRRWLLPKRAKVTLYPLRVEQVLDHWQEAHQRERRWFTREQAAEAVAERELKRLILAFQPPTERR